MSRIYHSASSDALGRRCHRAWWYQYVAGIRDPRVEWSTISAHVADRKRDSLGTLWWRDPLGKGEPVKSRQRSTALGVAMHERIEGWYNKAAVDWYDLPGQIALSGLHFLPHPTACTARTESPIGDAAIVGETDAHAPPVGFRVAGVLWAGYRDLIADGVLYDYKSSADIGRYALTPAELATDMQASLYSLATMVELGTDAISARWVYFETKRRRYAEPRDVTITRAGATDVVMAGCERARHLDTLQRESDATPNTNACGDYGGCPHHHSVGGPCNAVQSFGALVQARVRKKADIQMVLPPGIAAMTSPPNGASPGSSFGQQAAPLPVEDVVTPPPPPPAVKERKPRQAAAVAPPPAPVAAAPAPIQEGAIRTMSLDGAFGPLTLSGHAADVIDAITILKGAP